VATLAAVVLPEIFHLAGTAAGVGPDFAQAWLPMFLPVIVVGLLAGSTVGAVVGVASPLIAFALTGMPAGLMLPLVMVELIAAGVVAGLVARRSTRSIGSVAGGTVAVVAAAPVALLLGWLAVGLLAGNGAAFSAWWTQVTVGAPGLVVQLVAVAVALALLGRRR